MFCELEASRMRVELHYIVFKIPLSVNMNNECAPSVPRPPVPICKRHLLLQVKVAGHICPSYILQEHPSGGWRECNSQEREEEVDGDLASHAAWQHQLTLRDSGAAAHPTKIMLHTWATTDGGITRVSRVSGHQPAAAGGQQTLAVLYRVLHKCLFPGQIKDPPQVLNDKSREMLVNAPMLGTAI